MYHVLLTIHSWLRWLVLGAGLVAVFQAYAGWTGRRPFTKGNNAVSAAFSGFMWLQVIVGLGLYFGVSPWGLNGLKNLGMHDPTARFYGVEHITAMLLATILVQVGRLAAKRTPDDTRKHKLGFIYGGIALLLVLLMIPWGIWNPHGELFRF